MEKIKKGEGYCHGRFSLIQERRFEQEQRLKVRELTVRDWYNGQWRLMPKPCKCGRNHYALQSKSRAGLEEHCPCVYWGWLIFFYPGYPVKQDQMARPIT